MRLVAVGLVLVGSATLVGCTSSHPTAIATVHGDVVLVGGPAPAPGQSGVHTGSGSVLVFTTASRTGSPALTVRINSSGSYAFQVRAGHYYLATTAATFNGVPANGPSISVAAGQDLRVDINPSIK